MRSRIIKPSFFKDEDIGVLEPWIQLLYIGLWCLADKDGRLEDRPLRIKAEVFPYADHDVSKGLTILANVKSTGQPFIHRYRTDKDRYISIPTWEEHQHPHHTEAESKIPKPTVTVTDTVTVTISDHQASKELSNGETTVKSPLDTKVVKKQRVASATDEFFEQLWKDYPNRVGKAKAYSHYKHSVLTDEDRTAIRLALDKYKMSKPVQEGYIQHGSRWFHEWRDWAEVIGPETKCPKCNGKGYREYVGQPREYCKCPAGEKAKANQ